MNLLNFQFSTVQSGASYAITYTYYTSTKLTFISKESKLLDDSNIATIYIMSSHVINSRSPDVMSCLNMS